VCFTCFAARTKKKKKRLKERINKVKKKLSPLVGWFDVIKTPKSL
jgi:hypothetical protein